MRGVLKGVVGGGMGAKLRIKVAQNSDADGVAHGLIVLDGTHVARPGRASTWLETWCTAEPNSRQAPARHSNRWPLTRLHSACLPREPWGHQPCRTRLFETQVGSRVDR